MHKWLVAIAQDKCKQARSYIFTRARSPPISTVGGTVSLATSWAMRLICDSRFAWLGCHLTTPHLRWHAHYVDANNPEYYFDSSSFSLLNREQQFFKVYRLFEIVYCALFNCIYSIADFAMRRHHNNSCIFSHELSQQVLSHCHLASAYPVAQYRVKIA